MKKNRPFPPLKHSVAYIYSVHKRHKTTAKGQVPYSGLTLVELLVAIAIIAILAAISIPTVSQSRKVAQATTCVSNLKQVGTAILLFAGEHQGNILPRQLSTNRQNAEPNAASYWIRRLVNEGYLDGPITSSPMNPSLSCPTMVPDPQQTVWTSTYGMREWRGTIGSPGEYLPINQILYPSRLFLLTDSIHTSTGNQWYAIQFNSASNGAHLRHSGKANAFFADGHVAAVDAKYFQSLPENDPEFTYRPFNVFGPDGATVEP